jgi:hypothetical protein
MIAEEQAMGFDPYYEWLGIPPRSQPPHHYRLLGIALFEENPSVIEHAADRQMGHVKQFQTGQHSAETQRLLNEIVGAKLCLLRPDSKRRYDAALFAKIYPAHARPIPLGTHRLQPADPAPLEPVRLPSLKTVLAAVATALGIGTLLSCAL